MSLKKENAFLKKFDHRLFYEMLQRVHYKREVQGRIQDFGKGGGPGNC